MHTLLLLAYYFVSLCQHVLLLFIILTVVTQFSLNICMHICQKLNICCFYSELSLTDFVETFIGGMMDIYRLAVHILVNSGKWSPAVVIVDKWMLFCWQWMVAKSCANTPSINQPFIGQSDLPVPLLPIMSQRSPEKLIRFLEVSALKYVTWHSCQIGLNKINKFSELSLIRATHE